MTEDAADLDRLSEEGDALAEGRKPGEKRTEKPNTRARGGTGSQQADWGEAR